MSFEFRICSVPVTRYRPPRCMILLNVGRLLVELCQNGVPVRFSVSALCSRRIREQSAFCNDVDMGTSTRYQVGSSSGSRRKKKEVNSPTDCGYSANSLIYGKTRTSVVRICRVRTWVCLERKASLKAFFKNSLRL